MALKENSRKIYDYVVAHEAENITAQDIADALGLGVRSVNGSVTSAFCRKGLMERVEAEIKLTDEGRAFDPDAAE